MIVRGRWKTRCPGLNNSHFHFHHSIRLLRSTNSWRSSKFLTWRVSVLSYILQNVPCIDSGFRPLSLVSYKTWKSCSFSTFSPQVSPSSRFLYTIFWSAPTFVPHCRVLSLRRGFVFRIGVLSGGGFSERSVTSHDNKLGDARPSCLAVHGFIILFSESSLSAAVIQLTRISTTKSSRWVGTIHSSPTNIKRSRKTGLQSHWYPAMLRNFQQEQTLRQKVATWPVGTH